MSKAEEILRQQKEEQTTAKTAEESARVAKAKLEVHENEVKKAAIDAGFDPADPIKGWHAAVDSFNKEKDEFDAEKQKFAAWVKDYNLNLERLNTAQKKFQEEVATQQAKSKTTYETLATKSRELDTTVKDIIEKQKIVQTIANQISEKEADLDDVEYRLKIALTKCKKLVLEAEYRHDKYYNLALSDQWGKVVSFTKNLFRDLRL